MTRWNGFFLIVMMFVLFIVGGWLTWNGVELLRYPPPVYDLTKGPATKWYYIQVIVGVLVIVVGLRTGMAGLAGLREEEHIIFFLPSELWSLALGIVAFIFLYVGISGRLSKFLSDERPKRCKFRYPTSSPFTGKEWKCHKNGRWASSGAWKKGKKDGAWEQWHPNGKRKWTGHFKMGVRHGRFQTFNVTGRMIQSYQYKHGKLDGRIIENYNKGAFTPLKMAGFYDKGERCGRWTYWDAFVRGGMVQRKLVKTQRFPSCDK